MFERKLDYQICTKLNRITVYCHLCPQNLSLRTLHTQIARWWQEWGGGEVVVRDRERVDKGPACVISRYTNSIEEYNMIDYNRVCIQQTFLRFWSRKWGHWNVIKMGSSPLAVFPFDHFAFLCSPHSVKDCSANPFTFLPWPAYFHLVGKTDVALRQPRVQILILPLAAWPLEKLFGLIALVSWYIKWR